MMMMIMIIIIIIIILKIKISKMCGNQQNVVHESG